MKQLKRGVCIILSVLLVLGTVDLSVITTKAEGLDDVSLEEELNDIVVSEAEIEEETEEASEELSEMISEETAEINKELPSGITGNYEGVIDLSDGNTANDEFNFIVANSTAVYEVTGINEGEYFYVEGLGGISTAGYNSSYSSIDYYVTLYYEDTSKQLTTNSYNAPMKGRADGRYFVKISGISSSFKSYSFKVSHLNMPVSYTLPEGFELEVYPGVYANSLLDMVNNKLSKTGIEITEKVGENTVTRTIYTLKPYQNNSYSHLSKLVYNEATGQYEKDSQMLWHYNLKPDMEPGKYILTYSTIFTVDKVPGAIDFEIPVTVKSLADMPNIQKNENGTYTQGVAPFNNFHSEGNYTYFAADVEAGKTYTFNTSGTQATNVYLFAYYVMNGQYGSTISRDSMFNGKNAGNAFSPSYTGTYYFIAYYYNTTSEVKLWLGAKEKVTLNVGDEFEVNGTKQVVAGSLKSGDIFEYTGTGPKYYLLTGLDASKGYQFCTLFNGEINNYFAAPIYSYDVAKDVNGNKVVTLSQYSNTYINPESGKSYLVVFNPSTYGQNTYKLVSNKKPTNIKANFTITWYEDLVYSPFSTYLSTKVSDTVKIKGLDVTYTDGTTEKVYEIAKLGYTSAQLYDSTGNQVRLTDYDSIIGVKPGKYTYKYTMPANFSIPVTVYDRSQAPKIYYKSLNGEYVAETFECKGFSNIRDYNYFSLELQTGKSYRISRAESSGQDYFRYTLIDQNGKEVIDSNGAVRMRELSSSFSVEEDGNYYLVVYVDTTATYFVEEQQFDKITNLELAEETDYNDTLVRNLTPYENERDRVSNYLMPVFKATYSTGALNYISSINASQIVKFEKVVMPDKVTVVSNLVHELEAGDYFACYKASGYEEYVYVPFTVSNPSDVTEELILDEEKEISGFNRLTDEVSSVLKVYRVNLSKNKTYSFSSDPSDAYAELILKDELGNVLGRNQYVNGIKSGIQYTPKADQTAYIVLFQSLLGKSEVFFGEYQSISKVTVTKEMNVKTFYENFDRTVYLNGYEFEVEYANGKKETIDKDHKNLSNGEGWTINFNIVQQDAQFSDGTQTHLNKECSGEYILKFANFATQYSLGKFQVIKANPKTITLGENVRLSKRAEFVILPIDRWEYDFNTDVGEIYQIFLRKDKSYRISTDFYGDMEIYDYSFMPMEDSYRFSYRHTNSVFTPERSGTYYFRISSDSEADFMISDDFTFSDVSVLHNPYGTQEKPYYIGLEGPKPYGMEVRVSFEDGSYEDVLYGEKNWDQYIQEYEITETEVGSNVYTCKLHMVDGSDITSEPFVQEASVWVQQGNIVKPNETIKNAKAFDGKVYIQLSVSKEGTYQVSVKNASLPLCLWEMTEEGLKPLKEIEVVEENQDSYFIDFTYTANPLILSYSAENSESAEVTLYKTQVVSSLKLSENQAETRTLCYGENAYPEGLMLDLKYNGEETSNMIVVSSMGCYFKDSLKDYLPGFQVSVLMEDKLTTVKKDSLGFYPVNNAGETYYWKISLKEDSNITQEIYVPFTVKVVENDYTVSYHNNLENVLKADPTAKITGSMSLQKMTKDKIGTLLPNKFVYKGYSLIGWSTNDSIPVLMDEQATLYDLHKQYPGEYYKPNEKVMNLSSDGSEIKLYAVWKIDIYQTKYTIRFIGQQETVDTIPFQDVYADKKVTLKPNKYQNGNKAFLGWSTNPDVLLANITSDNYEAYVDYLDKETIVLSPEELKALDENQDHVINLYAVWGNSFAISYDYNGDGVLDRYEDIASTGLITMEEELRPESYQYKNVKAIDLKPVRKGYTFNGWYLDPTYKKKFSKITDKTSGNIELYAKWTQNSYNIAFSSNGGSGKMKTIKAYYYDELEKPENQVEISLPECTFTRKGYYFDEWEVLGNYATFVPGDQVSNLTFEKNKTITLIAKWELDSYIAKLNTFGGHIENALSIEGENQLYQLEYMFNDPEMMELPVPVKEGYTFGGWYTDKNYNKQVKNLNNLAADISLYAKWCADYTLILSANNGSGIKKEINGNTGKAIALTNTFKMPGYAFLGWSVAAPNSAAWNAADRRSDLVVYSNKYKLISPDAEYIMDKEGQKTVILYAVWEKNFKLTFDPLCQYVDNADIVNGTELSGYTYGTEVKVLPKPERTGYVFSGWYADANLKKKVTKITKKDFGDKTLYAKWTPAKYTIRYQANAPEGCVVKGKVSNQKMTYTVNKKLNKCKYTAPGYTFVGWSTSPNGYIKYQDAEEVSVVGGRYKPEVTLYAIWKPVNYAE